MPEPATRRTAPDDWSGYYRMTEGRAVRPLFTKGMAAVEAAGTEPGRAVDIGFGDGTETVALLRDGWAVTAIDSSPQAAAILRGKVPPGVADRLDIVTAGLEAAAIPPFDFLYAGYALSFVHPSRFASAWAMIRGQMRPGAVLAVNVFGVRDTWAGDGEMTFVDRAAAAALIDGLQVVAFDEEDADGPSGAGPKHWHVFDLVARRPGPAR